MKKFISLLCAFSLFLCTFSFPLFLDDTLTVSAFSSDTSIYITSGFTNIRQFNSHQQEFLQSFPFPSGTFQIITSRILETESGSGISGNTGVLSFDLNSMHNWGTVVKDGTTFILYVNRSSRKSIPDYIPEFYDFQGDLVSLSNQTFFVALPLNNYNYVYMHNFNNGMMNGQDGFLDSYSNYDVIFWSDASITSLSFNTYFLENTFVPEVPDALVTFPVGLDFSVSAFVRWIVDNNRIGDLPAYIGSSKLQSFLEFYKQLGSSNTSFLSRISDWFTHMNIASQTNENIIFLKGSIDSLYREFINSHAVKIYPNTSNHAHNRHNINTQTTDDDLTLVTNDENDDIYTKLLREIVRGIVALQSSTISGFNYLADIIDNLNFSVLVSNNGGQESFVDLSSLYTYSSDDFNDDLNEFSNDIADIQQLPVSYVSEINNNPLMPEHMLSDKDSLSVNIPNISGFTVTDNGKSLSTQTTTYNLNSDQYPWLDAVCKKIKRFGSILLIIGYLIHLRYKIPDIVRGE